MASYALASANIHPYDGTWFTVSATACPSRQQPHFSWLLNRVPSPWIISPRFGVKAENLGNHPPRCFKSSIPLESQGQPLLVEGIPEIIPEGATIPESLYRHPGGQFVVNKIQGCHHQSFNAAYAAKNPSSAPARALPISPGKSTNQINWKVGPWNQEIDRTFFPCKRR